MKKFITILLAIAMVMCCAACGGATAPQTEPSQSASAPTDTTEQAALSELNYPEKTIHIIVTFSAGGGNDVIARAVASGLEEVTGQTVVVDNITGGGGMTGSYEAMSSAPDGYTILCQDASLTASLVTQAGQIPLTLDDMVPVASVYSCPTWALSNAENGYDTLQDFVDDAKANPGKLTIGTAVTTGAQYLMACAIVDYFDLDVTIIPYDGGNELKSAVLGNHVDMGIIHSPILLPEVREGMIKVLVAGNSLDGIAEESLRDVKTLSDYGMDCSFSSTRGFFLPKDTPVEIVSYLEDAFAKALDTDVVKEFAVTFGYEPKYRDSSEYHDFLVKEIEDFSAAYNASKK